ncbi:uncharacterized protein LOC113638168 isoform X2 [Tachysurus fulvidraco]|uniref:uncharacterized protein LOC113638168 isoform X2 n=1 Tax=Tachysurus fulvidraco TaxID=1234273 RepID=UPI001FF00A83|nr:uncharacterized protein LOC113638168 isoform X2 [Tachysurus fulvidraco]
MSQILSLFTPPLLFGVFWPSILQITSADHVSVHPGENITLHCNISITTNYTQILWYQLGSEEVKLLISAEQGRLNKKFLPTYNVNESQFDITERCSLVIIDVRQTNLGFYYCEGRKDKTHIQFEKPIRLSFTEDHDTSSKHPDTELCTGSEMWITRIVCLISVLINLICMCVICYRFKGRSSSSSSSSSSSYCCSNIKGSTEKMDKEENVHYASIQHKRKHRAASKKKTSSDLDCVTYATVNLQARRH